MNTGSGAFATKVIYGTGTLGISSIVSADFNNDGYQDIAISIPASGNNPGTIRVFLNDGSGAYGTSFDYVTGQGVSALVTGDFDENGLLDLVSIEGPYGHTIALRLNNGSW